MIMRIWTVMEVKHPGSEEVRLTQALSCCCTLWVLWAPTSHLSNTKTLVHPPLLTTLKKKKKQPKNNGFHKVFLLKKKIKQNPQICFQD